LRLDWKKKRIAYQERLKDKGFASIHNYRISTNEVYKENQRQRSNKSNYKVVNITDNYIRQLIRQKDKTMKSVQIPKELIELYRANLLLKRELNEKQRPS